MSSLSMHRRQTTGLASQPSHLSVALLMDNMEQARELARLFKRMDIHPYVYQDLKEFWRGTLEKLPSLSIIDVRLTSAGDLFLKNHPYIKSEQMPLIFYTNEASRPLMTSVMNIFHLGEIREEASLQQQVKANLKRLNKIMALEECAHTESYKNQKYDEQIDGLIHQNQSFKEKEYYQKLLNSYCQRFEMRQSDDDFMSACAHVLTHMKEVREFAFLELSESKQKLISPDFEMSKFRRIPSLWLGQTCREGIEPFAQNMASQVGVDLMGGELMSLGIRGSKNYPAVMLFFKIEDTEMLNLFDWESFERFLSGLYCAYELRHMQSFVGPKHWLNSWEFMDLLDTQLYGADTENTEGTTQKWQLINLSFKDLVETIQEKPQRFYWKRFYEDFMSRLGPQVRADFKVCPFGLDLMSFMVREEDAHSFFVELKSFSARFSYWKYFEHSEHVLGRNLRPDVRMAAFASRGYLKSIEQEQNLRETPVELEKLREDAPKKLNVWGPGPEQNM